MGSRIKENPDKIFDGFFEVLRPTALDQDPVLQMQFPEHFDDQDSVTTLTRFCFPFDVERWENPSVQHFSFTLTDLLGFQRFGFCRLSVASRSCLCILSCLPWFEHFYKLLNNIAEYLAKDQSVEICDLLQTVYHHPVPQENTALSLEMLSYFIAPDPTRLPSVPENRNLTEFLVAVQVDTMLHLYSSLLCERRILITSSKLSTLTACVHASAALLYPMYWQHIYIPTLPPHLLDYCSAPMPYLIGVHSSLMEKVNIKSLEDVVIFNMDTNNLETPFKDLDNLPPHVVSLLKLRLKKPCAVMGDGVSQVFLKAQALLFGGYRDALIYTPGQAICFCQESFLNHKCSAMRSFLQNAIHLQLFTQFIDSRLEKLNAGVGFTDAFEQEITNCGLSGNSKSYQMWLEHLKKGGGSLINNVKSRTHPAVRNMLRYAKGQAKTGLQGMRSRIKQKDQFQLHRGGSLRGDEGSTHNHERLQNRLPITQHFGHSRPRRPGKKYSDSNLWDSESYPQAERKDESTAMPAAEDDFPLLQEKGMDLLEEIFETLNTRAPGEERALYGTHSLDFFNLDDSQYFTRFQSINPTSDEDLSMSQPRDSSLWYLQEEDEEPPGFFSESPEVTSLSSEPQTPDIVSLNTEDPSLPAEDTLVTSQLTSLTSDTKPSTRVATAPILDSLTTNYISPTAEQAPCSDVKSQLTDRSLPTVNVCPSNLEVTTKETTIPSPESEIPPTTKEESKPVSGLPTGQLSGHCKAERETSGGISSSVSGPCVRAAISRFQALDLDPRMTWKGNRKEENQTQRAKRWNDQQLCNMQQANNPNSISMNSTQKLNLQSNNIPTSRGANTPNAHLDNIITREPDGVPSSKPKVSELKKRFET